jgi:two-component system response regulator AtoC
VDVRVIAATNRDLRKAVDQGTFREDIYYRLNVVNITIPPLTERKEDVTYLFEYFLDAYNEKYGKNIQVDKDVLYPLCHSYPWPGNVRELKNQVKRLVILGDVGDLIQYLKSGGAAPGQERPVKESPRPVEVLDIETDDKEVIPLKLASKEAVIKAERNMILKALRGTNWNKKRAAQLLQISYKALLYKIKECGIEK